MGEAQFGKAGDKSGRGLRRVAAGTQQQSKSDRPGCAD